MEPSSGPETETAQAASPVTGVDFGAVEERVVAGAASAVIDAEVRAAYDRQVERVWSGRGRQVTADEAVGLQRVAQADLDHALDSLRYTTASTPNTERPMDRPTLNTIIELPCDQIRRHLKKRDGFRKTTTHTGAGFAAHSLVVPERLPTAPMANPFVNDLEARVGEPTIRQTMFRLVSASLRVGTPQGIVKELWYEEQ